MIFAIISLCVYNWLKCIEIRDSDGWVLSEMNTRTQSKFICGCSFFGVIQIVYICVLAWKICSKLLAVSFYDKGPKMNICVNLENSIYIKPLERTKNKFNFSALITNNEWNKRSHSSNISVLLVFFSSNNDFDRWTLLYVSWN